MDTNQLLDDDHYQERLSLSQEAQNYLREASRWAFFLSIIGFISAGFLILAGIFSSITFSFMGNEFNDLPFPPALLGLFYIVFGVVYIFPTLYLYRFSDKIKQGLNRESTELTTTAFFNLKALFKFTGIMTIVIIAFYILAIIAAMATTFMMLMIF